MKRVAMIAALALSMSPAFAQQPPVPYVSTTDMLLRQALNCENVASAKITELQAQLVEVTKERDELRAAAKPKD